MYEHKNLAILIRALLDKLDSRSNFWTRKRMSDLHSPIDINLERDEMEIRSYMTKIKGDSLEELFPDIAKEWHPTKNGDRLPRDYMANSNTKVWWKCENGHEWENAINTRNGGHGCPYCANQIVLPGFNDLATINPTLAAQWHPTKNQDITQKDVMPGSNKKAWWICENGHEWEAVIASRNKGVGCQECYNIRRGRKKK